MLLSEEVKITKVQGHTTASTTTVNSDSVDMADYDSVMFVTSFGTANSGNAIKAAQSTASTTSFGDLVGTLVGVGASDEDQFVDVKRPVERYVRCTAIRGGASSTLESIWAFQYNARDVPVDNTIAGTIHGEQHVSPSTGTA